MKPFLLLAGCALVASAWADDNPVPPVAPQDTRPATAELSVQPLRMPNGDSSGMVEGSYGSRDRISLRAAADFALTSNLFMRISGVSKRQDGYVDQLDFGCVYPAGGSATSNASGVAVVGVGNVALDVARILSLDEVAVLASVQVDAA